ncbi:hypothetical protein Sste5346_002934 [Sporothrix stenoceras]|uniref:non-specific serine/threonine protein kinase n=1 Tax=Sporothrix stenoceras TaxID=5173 RepID=A0ABR3ZI86_9PEZI
MDFHKVLVMDLLGPSLENLFQDSGRRFSIKTTAMLAKQMITRIQTLHQHDLIYRDIKPENFLMGLPGTDAANSVHLIDYGMAKMYRDPDTNKHIPFGDAQSLSGTARYMSINAHCRRSQSRRDDLEALGHVFLYFVRGNLPWQGVKAPQNDSRHDLMCEKKQAISIDDLCRGYPPQFSEYLIYTRGMTFEQDPDYDYLRSLFTKVLEDDNSVDDNAFDWIRIKAREEELTAAQKADLSATANLDAKPVTATVQPPSPFVKRTEDPRPKATEATEPIQRPATPPQVVASSSTGTGGHRAMIVVPPPASPPGAKRRRSEFASDLKPPTRIIRPKKSAYAFYDSQAQNTLVTLYRDVMARRYNFHRAVKQARPGLSSAASAAAAAAAALAARTSTTPGMYSRPVTPRRAMGGGASVVSPEFTDTLDKTLGKVISELEEMSDKLLQDGDYTGAVRVQGWLEEVSTSVKEETDRLQKEQEKEQLLQKEQQQQLDEAVKSSPALLQSTEAVSPAPGRLATTAERKTGPLEAVDIHGSIEADSSLVPTRTGAPHPIAAFDPADPLEVDDGEDDDDGAVLDESSLRTQYLSRPGFSSFPRRLVTSRRVPAVAASSPRASTVASPVAGSPVARPYSRGSPAAAVRSRMGHLSLEVDDDIIAADDGDDNNDGNNNLEASDDKIDADDSCSNEILELVYRTASGTRKVVRVADEGAQNNPK